MAFFLDREMPLMNGLYAARKIVEMERPPAIIFCTAHDQFAIDAVNSSASAYLLKPVFEEDVSNAISKAQRVSKIQMNTLYNDVEKAESILIRSGKETSRKLVSEIYYFRSYEKNVYAGIQGDTEILVDYTLKHIALTYEQYFIRTHNSSLVNRGLITRLLQAEGGQMVVGLSGSEVKLPVSRRHLVQVREFIRRD
jgi:two-component system response regulator AlgR